MHITNDKHPSSAQKSIWHTIQMLAPFHSVEVRNNKGIDQEYFIKGQEEFYCFMKEMYYDMYENPSKYHIPTEPYDEYMQNRDEEKIRKKLAEKQHYTDGKECGLRNTFQQSIQFYPKFFYELGIRANLREDFVLKITADEYKEIIKALDLARIRGEQNKRIQVISKLGIEMHRLKDGSYEVSPKYPHMFLGLWILCNAPDSKYKYMNYLRLDYKGSYRTMPELEDIVETFTQENREKIHLFDELLKDLNMRMKVKPLGNITSGSKWKVEYILKGKNVFGFYGDIDHIMLCIYFNDSNNISAFSKTLQERDSDMFQWFCSHIPERLCKCPSNRWVVLGDQRRRICGLSNRVEVENPDTIDVDYSIKVLRSFRGL